MAAHIPFVNTDVDCKLVRKYYSDSPFCRVPLEKAGALVEQLRGPRLWIDPAVDGLHHLLQSKKRRERPEWREYFSQFDNYEQLADPSFVAAPKRRVVADFVRDVLDKAASFSPDWISVPQLPIVNDAGRNRTNRHLADAAAKWRSESRFKGKLILPVIFTHRGQLKGRKERVPRISVVRRCCEESEADGVWVAETTLTDDSGLSTNQARFSALVSWHEELAAKLDASSIIVAGPYWGLNLILWARGLADHPAIGVGTGYQYYIPGGPRGHAMTRIAIPPIRRRAVGTGDAAGTKGLSAWMGKAIGKLATEDPARVSLGKLKAQFDRWQDRGFARAQVAEFYKEWFDTIEACRAPARAHALFQDFTSAYVLGKNLPALPRTEKTATRPERVAEHFMMSCL